LLINQINTKHRIKKKNWKNQLLILTFKFIMPFIQLIKIKFK